MIIFMSQVPILVVTILVVLLVALLEMIGLKTRHNIAILSASSLVCLGAAGLMRDSTTGLSEVFYAVGAVLAAILALYALATARRGQQWAWFVSLLIAVLVTLRVVVGSRAAWAQQDPASTAPLLYAFTYAFTFVPAVGTLLYGLFAPDIPKPRGSM